jgi:hypothetical protein
MITKLADLIDQLAVKRHYLIVDDIDVLNVLEVINKHNKNLLKLNLTVGNCGWAAEPSKWFIHFDVSNKKWLSIVTDLTKNYTLVIKDRSIDDVFVVRTKREEV